MDLLAALYARVFSVQESSIMSEFADVEVPAPPELAELKQRLDGMIAAAREALAQHGAVALLPSTGR